MYAILVLKLGIAPNYVMDEMQMYEAKTLLEFGYYRHSEEWEQARLNAFVTAQCNSSKKLKVEDICEFAWEKESKEEKQKAEMMSDEQMARMREQAKALLENNLI